MGDSKAVSIRIPDELLARIDEIAEKEYKSHKGKPNRSLVILDAVVAHLSKLPDTISGKKIITESDTVSIVDFRRLQDFVATLSKDVESLQKSLIASSDTVIEVKSTEADQVIAKALDHTQLSVLTVEETGKGLTVTELAARFGIKPNDVTSKKSKTKAKPEIFVAWSKNKDPEGQAWEFRENSKLFYQVPPASLSEGVAEARLSHP
jgi:metal-responsive CopG/Arc/MetJ family transcriptional regulator